MARRSDHNREELKELAVSAGYKIMQSQGFREFSARKVANEIGYTVGTIYNVFGNHDDLILHINAKTLDHWYAALQQLVESSKRQITVLDIAKFYIHYSKAHYNEWSALFEHSLAPGKVLPEWYVPKLRKFFELVESLVLNEIGNNKRQARRAARVLWAGIHGICILSLSQKLDLVKSESAEILAKSFVDCYLAGLSKA